MAGGAARASPETDAFGKCLIQSSTGADRTVFVQWVFAAMSMHPDVQALGTVAPDKRAAIDAKMADVMQRLVLVACRTEAVAAYRQDGPQVAMSTSFETFGRVAASDLFADPKVTAEVASLTSYFDAARWGELVEASKK
jgi:hypothetical protein